MQDATSLAAAIASGQTTAPEVMKAALQAVSDHGGLASTVAVDAAAAMQSAAQVHRGPFAGVPFLGKDLGSGAAAFPPGAGCTAIRKRTRRACQDSLLFERFRKAGLVQMGLSTVPPFGLALTSDPARNPFNPDFSPGGSSGGAAAAVAAGIVAMAHATDAAGSIRVPAACCGLYGLKPSRGAVPAGPDFGNHLMGLASELVVARSIRDVMAAFDAVTGTSAAFCGDPTPVGFAKPPRVALCVPDRCDADQAEAAEAVAKALATLGAEVSEYPAPNALGARAATIARTILTASLAEWCSALAIDDEELPSIAAAVAAEGRTMPASLLFAASRDMARTGYELWHGFAAVDVILSPVLAHGPPPMGSFDMTKSTPAAHFAKMDDMAPNIALANVAGCPALAMPCGVDRRGLPIGIQLMSRTGSDTALMSLAARLSNEIPAITFPFAVAGHP